MDISNQFPTVMSKDLFGLVCGKKLGEGAYRTVYDFAPDQSLVIKVEDGSHSFHNVTEHLIWNELQYTKWAKWFAPVVSISPCGCYLLMKKTEPLSKKQYPKMLPKFLTDRKYPNYGRLKGKFVCHDYGSTVLGRITVGSNGTMDKCDWWE